MKWSYIRRLILEWVLLYLFLYWLVESLRRGFLVLVTDVGKLDTSGRIICCVDTTVSAAKDSKSSKKKELHCYAYNEIGHIASVCPNKRVIKCT